MYPRNRFYRQTARASTFVSWIARYRRRKKELGEDGQEKQRESDGES